VKVNQLHPLFGITDIHQKDLELIEGRPEDVKNFLRLVFITFTQPRTAIPSDDQHDLFNTTIAYSTGA
jgi:hypothetical protein